ncbi:hypothetical protein PsorP6_011161 [Peronosclerospora sorghi]|uniref:Uncharacterized protein n=1 Tax=Peronosclerospora sorghi TaxID=230839 RepID=A0ACC0VX51_9STRA|nr:hypothetical protein PsorP6_011161 [Peronosclerospora sorghi]
MFPILYLMDDSSLRSRHVPCFASFPESRRSAFLYVQSEVDDRSTGTPTQLQRTGLAQMGELKEIRRG